ncbi:MAG: alpha-ketoacid dehydrogenase subunit beta [Gemmatimonadetes bacterium]|nr:alpha-ketoacid dehydrogenase subunit beta [Gemmatimonadota bacterium]
MTATVKTSYGVAIRDGFAHLLAKHPKAFVMGQGLWSPWYVGNSMTNLEIEFGKERVIDVPVSEVATTGAGIGAALSGYRPIVVHPRVDFMMLAVDQIVTQAAKWRSMFGGDVSVPLVIRGIINRGGEQGAQHSQSLQSWFAHIPGLHVLMPATPRDARDMLIAATLCDDPVLYMDDRWCYELEEELPPAADVSINDIAPLRRRTGKDITLVGCGYTTKLNLEAAELLAALGIEADVIDLRLLNPLKPALVHESAAKTGRMLVVDGDWRSCGLAAEIIAGVAERPELRAGVHCARITHPDAPAPTSKPLEQAFYFTAADIVREARTLCGR